ncbi:MAG: hypothetical protein VX070_04945 [Bacteroidota bacterium]|nr:hypothetical protein [Bacteroidota bacterium]
MSLIENSSPGGCRLFSEAAMIKNDALDRHGLSNIFGSLVGNDFQN